MRPGEKAYFCRFLPGTRTLNRTDGLVVFDMIRLWLFRRRRCSLASRDKKLMVPHMTSAINPMTQNSSHSCFNMTLFYFRWDCRVKQ